MLDVGRVSKTLMFYNEPFSHSNSPRNLLVLCVYFAGLSFGRHGDRTVSTHLWLVAGHLLTGQLR